MKLLLISIFILSITSSCLDNDTENKDFEVKKCDNQFSHERKEQIESHKIAYLTTKLSLTPNEAEKFWPLYNEFSRKCD